MVDAFMEKHDIKLSKKLTFVLRHGIDKVGLETVFGMMRTSPLIVSWR